MQFEKVFDLFQVNLEQRSPLPLKLILNAAQLRSIVRPHVDKLQLHGSDQLINIVVHAVDEVDVGLIFGRDSVLELLDQFVLIFDDLLASSDLHLDIFSQLLAILLLLELLPVPVDFNVLFMRDEHLVFQLCSPLYAFLLFQSTPDILLMISLKPDLVDHLVGLTAHLLQNPVCFVDFLIAVSVDFLAFNVALLVQLTHILMFILLK